MFPLPSIQLVMRALPVEGAVSSRNVPEVNRQLVNVPLAVPRSPPKLFSPPVQFVNMPLAAPNPPKLILPAVQSMNVPLAVPSHPKLQIPPVQFLNIPLATRPAPTPKLLLPAIQFVNVPLALPW